ncbi:MAG: type II secretion system F family protein [Candidatus Micrarchaeota archaeon]
MAEGPITRFLNSYSEVVEFSGMRIPGKVLMPLTLALGFIAFAIMFFMLNLPIEGFLVLTIILDIGLGLPYYLADKKSSAIAEALPDVLHHMGTTLKTGGTIEVALKEASRMNFGPITPNLKRMIIDIDEGKTFEQAFSDFALKSRSELVKRAAVIIIAAKKSGGGLLDTLVAMSEDFRDLYHLEQERRSKTFTQFLFIVVAGILIAPAIFGLISFLVGVLLNVGGSMDATGKATVAKFDMMFRAYLMIQGALAMLGAVQIKEGNLSRAVIYIPVGMTVAYAMYFMGPMVFNSLVGGAFGA